MVLFQSSINKKAKGINNRMPRFMFYIGSNFKLLKLHVKKRMWKGLFFTVSENGK